MAPAPLPHDEAKRLEALRAYRLLDTAPEGAYDDLVRLAGTICGVPIALVSLVDERRLWFKARFGLEAPETSRDAGFCAHAILRDELLVVDDLCDDPRFADNPLVLGDPLVRFYAGSPLRARGGERLGTLCVIDHIPRRLTPGQRDALDALKKQVEAHLELRLCAAELAASERREREAGEALAAMRRQQDDLLRHLVHDLKSPVASVVMNARHLLDRGGLDAEARGAVEEVAEAGAALARLAHDMLDVGRGRAKGSALRREPCDALALARETVAALRRRGEARGVRVELAVNPGLGPFSADRELVRRALLNLVDNALRHSEPGGAVTVAASRAGGRVRLEVRDGGPAVDEADRAAIFEPFVRGEAPDAPGRRGRGLGLAFCRLAAEAHGGAAAYERRAGGENAFSLDLPDAPPGPPSDP